MISFIHIAASEDESSILRSGISASRRKGGPRGVYAVPVVPDFSITHQWARELRRSGARSFVCIQFRIPGNQKVQAGRFGSDQIEMTAAEAMAAVLTHTGPIGFEVVIPRKILPREITRVYEAPRITGWRYYPEAKGRPPFCRCKFCNRGEIRAQRLIREDA